MREITIDEARLSSPAEAHRLLAARLSFPAYYGHNLSALADCLGDVSEPTRIVVIRRSAATAPAMPAPTPMPVPTPAAAAADRPEAARAGWFDRLCRVIARAASENPCLEASFREG